VGLTLLTEQHANEITGVAGLLGSGLIFGTLPKICYAERMTSYLYERKIRIFDYPKFAEQFCNELRENAERLAADNGIPRDSVLGRTQPRIRYGCGRSRA
jgi:hypothetical protein